MVKTNVEKYVVYFHVDLDTTRQQTEMSKFDTTCRMSLDSAYKHVLLSPVYPLSLAIDVQKVNFPVCQQTRASLSKIIKTNPAFIFETEEEKEKYR